jgi:hypothetical protein
MCVNNHWKIIFFWKEQCENFDLLTLKDGQLGVGNDHLFVPTFVDSQYPIMDVAAGASFTLILQSNFTCQGKFPTDSTICSGRGICTYFNSCTCDPDFAGNNCQYFSCFEVSSVDPNVCSARGSCVGSNNCTCLPNSSGHKCENYQCNGKDSNANDVCSSNGVCENINTCKCNLRFLGNDCQILISARTISPLSQQIFLNKTNSFLVLSQTDIHPIAHDNIECRLSGLFASKAKIIGLNKIQCNLTVTKEESLSIWYNGNQIFEISSSPIDLLYFGIYSVI